jgi:hypothetical protein
MSDLVDIFSNFLETHAIGVVVTAVHQKITKDEFIELFIKYNPKIYVEKPINPSENSSFSILSMLPWGNNTPEKITPLSLGEHVFKGLTDVGIVGWDGWIMPDYMIYTENITETRVNTLVSNLPENVKEQYTIDSAKLLQLLKSVYKPEQKGGKKRRKSKRRIKQ